MFKQLKKIFGRSSQAASQGWTSTAVAESTQPKPTPARLTPRPVQAAPSPAPVSAPRPVPEYNDEDISIPLQSVLNNLPPELKVRVIPMDLGGATLTVALHKILSQLPQGAVKLSFGELRLAATQLFSPGDQFDHQDFDLPLNEILVRINPALLPQPSAQKTALTTDVMENSFNISEPALPVAESPDFFPVPPRSGQGPMRVPLPTTPTSNNSSAAEIPMRVALAPLAADWPAEVRAEIVQLNCSEAQITLPGQLVQKGMQRGKVVFPWQTIRSWISPALPPVVSKHDSTVLELPLEVLMPLFISRLKQATKTQPRVVVDESIPALFGPAASPEAPGPVVNNNATPEAPVPVVSNDSALEAPAPVVSNGSSESAAKGNTTAFTPKTPSTDFKNRYISPTEVVTRAIALNGVAGTLVVLPEGLLVAAKISTNQDADALAAFLARGFGRVNQCARESQVGELSHMQFTANDVLWQIFRLHGVLFAAFSQAGGTLPTPQLAALAGEFDRKK